MYVAWPGIWTEVGWPNKAVATLHANGAHGAVFFMLFYLCIILIIKETSFKQLLKQEELSEIALKIVIKNEIYRLHGKNLNAYVTQIL